MAPVVPERDPAEALLAARDIDGVEEEPPAPAEAELFQRVRDDRARARTIRRSLAMAGVALVLLVVALLAMQRAPRSPVTANVPTAEVPTPSAKAATSAAVPAPPEERRAAAVTLPPRPARETKRAPEPRSPETAADPAAIPGAVTLPGPDVRVEVAQTRADGAVDYTVRLSRRDGEPVRDADVRLRGVMTDGALVEARLDPGPEPGVYHSLIAFSPRGPRGLTVRVARADGVVEVPVGDPRP